MNKSWFETNLNHGQLDMREVIWRLIELQKCIWDYLNVCGNVREWSTYFMKKCWANMACILDEIDDQEKDGILSLQYNKMI